VYCASQGVRDGSRNSCISIALVVACQCRLEVDVEVDCHGAKFNTCILDGKQRYKVLAHGHTNRKSNDHTWY
jgi:hypothetical protein